MDRGTLYLEERGLLPETIDHFGLAYVPSMDAIRIPYFDGLGRERGERYRLLGSDKKYHSPKGTPHHLYNVRDSDAQLIFLTEGEFDCQIMWQLGVAAVGVPGAKSFKEEWRWLFVGKKIVVLFDGDEEGRKGATHIRRLLGPLASEVEVYPVPDGEDVTSLYLNYPLYIEEEILGY